MPTDATRPTDDEVLEPLCSNCGGLGEISDGLSSATCRQCDGRGRLTTPQPHIAAEPGEVERELCARCGCYRFAHDDDGGELVCPPTPGARFTATEPRTAGEGALADDRTIRELGFAIKDAVNEAWPAEKRDRVARAALKCIALRQPSTDRESVIEECAKVADRIASARRHAQRGNIGNRTCADEAEGASAVATALRALKASSKGGDHG